MSYLLERRQFVALPLTGTFAFHAEPRNLGMITPGWLAFGLLGVRRGGRRQRRGNCPHPNAYGAPPRLPDPAAGVPQRWTSEITEWDPPRRFVDEQVRVPTGRGVTSTNFARCRAARRSSTGSSYALPPGALGRLAHALFVRRQLRAIFDDREAMVGRILVQDSTGEGK